MRKRTRSAIGAAVATLALVLAIPAAAHADWGAISIDPVTGNYGLAYDYSSQHGAKVRSRHECHTGHCQVAVVVQNGWAALVQKRTTGYYFGGYGRSKHDAVQEALRRAHESNARRVAYVFSGY